MPDSLSPEARKAREEANIRRARYNAPRGRPLTEESLAAILKVSGLREVKYPTPAPTRRNCGHCHECGERLSAWRDGQEWCWHCERFRRYASHGYADGEGPGCPPETKEPE